jgi:phage recombination protein Bet
MSQALTISPPQSALAVMAGRLQCDPAKLLGTLKSTVFKGATDEELMALTVVANQYGLNPFLKEIHAFAGKGGGIVPIVGIDGWLRIINDHPQMDGIETDYTLDSAGQPISCTCTIWRKDRSRPVKVTEYLSECRRPTDPWKMPFRMLRHKAEIQAARVAFGLGGIYDEDEAHDMKPAQARVVPAANVPEFLPPPQMQLPSGDPEPEPDPRRTARKTAAAAPPAQDPPPLELSPDGPTPRETIRGAITRAGLDWEEVEAVLIANGIIEEPTPLGNIDDAGVAIIAAKLGEVIEFAKNRRAA